MESKDITTVILVGMPMALYLGILWINRYYSRSKSFIADANSPNATAKKKSAWDKLLILSKLFASIAAILAMIIAMYKVFHS